MHILMWEIRNVINMIKIMTKSSPDQQEPFYVFYFRTIVYKTSAKYRIIIHTLQECKFYHELKNYQLPWYFSCMTLTRHKNKLR